MSLFILNCQYHCKHKETIFNTQTHRLKLRLSLRKWLLDKKCKHVFAAMPLGYSSGYNIFTRKPTLISVA